MKLQIKISKFEWWFWVVTFICIITAIAGWTTGYYLVMIISAIQILYFSVKEKSLVAFDTQVRIVYFACTLFGFWPAVRFYIYILLLIGTFMVTFFDKCSIAMVLKKMPWNKSIGAK